MNPLGILALMGAGAGALAAPDEAEAAMYPWVKSSMLKILASKGVTRKPDGRVLLAEPKRPSMAVGYWEPNMLKEAQKAYPDANNRIFTNAHDLGKRFNQRNQLPRETLNQLQALLDAKNGRLVKNYSKSASSAPFGMIARYGNDFVFAPLEVRHGDFYLREIVKPSHGQARRMLQGGGGPVPSYPVQASVRSGAMAFPPYSGSQLVPLSAVTQQQDETLPNKPQPVNQDPYRGDRVERDPDIDPISALYGAAGVGKSAAAKGLGYLSDLAAGGILDAWGKGETPDDTYGDGILWHLGLTN